MRVVEGRPVVDGVYVNGHGPYRFLVDTGTTMNVLEPALAKEAGLKATFRTELASSLGVMVVGGGEGVTLTLAGVRADNQKFLISKMELVGRLSSNIQGILGQCFLSRFDYSLDMRRKQLVFGKQERDGLRTALQGLYERMVVATSLGNMVLDSGAAQLVLFGLEAVNNGQTLMHTLSGFSQVGMIPRQLSIEGRRVWAGQAVAIPRQEEPGVAGLLPARLFRTVYVCNSEHYLIFE
jgi:hypothetical protein